MVWDHPECNPFAGAGGDWDGAIADCAKLMASFRTVPQGFVSQVAAQSSPLGYAAGCVTSTDPPYYDNVWYADLSDFYYVWLRPTLKAVLPALFTTVAVPKSDELAAANSVPKPADRQGTFFDK